MAPLCIFSDELPFLHATRVLERRSRSSHSLFPRNITSARPAVFSLRAPCPKGYFFCMCVVHLVLYKFDHTKAASYFHSSPMRPCTLIFLRCSAKIAPAALLFFAARGHLMPVSRLFWNGEVTLRSLTRSLCEIPLLAAILPCPQVGFPCNDGAYCYHSLAFSAFLSVSINALATSRTRRVSQGPSCQVADTSISLFFHFFSVPLDWFSFHGMNSSR